MSNDGHFASEYNVIGYYPKYTILDELTEGHDRIDIFIDLRNAMAALYYEDFIKFITAKYIRHRMMDYTMLTSMLTFTAWHKTYAKRRKKDIHLHWFLESGSSTYHKTHHKDYKSSRDQGSFALTPLA